MSSIQYTVSVDLGAEMALSIGLRSGVLPLINQAINGVAQATAARWIESVQRAKLWSGEKDAYAKTITYRMTGEFSAVVESDYRYAADIENGRPPRDLKKMLDTSMKVRRTMSGTRFLIIPFRHNVDAMPTHVQTAARALSASSITGQGVRRAGEIVSARVGMGMLPLGEKRQRRSPFASDPSTHKAAVVPKMQYNWGARLAAGSMGPNAKGKSDRFAGMYRFDASGGGAKSSTYLTFRVMSEKSKGWIVPAQPGQHIAEGVAKEMQPMAEAFIAEAVRRTSG